MSVVEVLAGCSAKELEALRDELRSTINTATSELKQVEDAVGLQMQKGLSKGTSSTSAAPESSKAATEPSKATATNSEKKPAAKATGGKKRGPKGKTQNLVLSTVKSSDAPMAPKDILAAIKENGNGISEGSVRNTIFRLAREEKLVKSGDDGGYVVAEGIAIEA